MNDSGFQRISKGSEPGSDCDHEHGMGGRNFMIQT